MSLHFLLDGYNVIKQTPSLNHGTLENQRQALLRWIQVHRPQGSLKNSVTVVFDGKEEIFGFSDSVETKVIFSKGETADDVIRRIVEGSSSKKRLVVVSNDKGIKFCVRALGAGVLSVEEFTATTQKKKPGLKENFGLQESTGKHVSLTQQAKINKELEKIWLKPKI